MCLTERGVHQETPDGSSDSAASVNILQGSWSHRNSYSIKLVLSCSGKYSIKNSRIQILLVRNPTPQNIGKNSSTTSYTEYPEIVNTQGGICRGTRPCPGHWISRYTSKWPIYGHSISSRHSHINI